MFMISTRVIDQIFKAVRALLSIFHTITNTARYQIQHSVVSSFKSLHIAYELHMKVQSDTMHPLVLRNNKIKLDFKKSISLVYLDRFEDFLLSIKLRESKFKEVLKLRLWQFIILLYKSGSL